MKSWHTVHFAAKHAARERSLAHARLLIRHAGNAIRAVHRREFDAAERLLGEARDEIAAIQSDLAGLPELYYHNYITDALKEFAEARLTVAVVREEELPLPDDLGIGYVAYFNGLAEAVGELRRFTLDALRRDDYATGERLLAAMDEHIRTPDHHRLSRRGDRLAAPHHRRRARHSGADARRPDRGGRAAPAGARPPGDTGTARWPHALTRSHRSTLTSTRSRR